MDGIRSFFSRFFRGSGEAEEKECSVKQAEKEWDHRVERKLLSSFGNGTAGSFSLRERGVSALNSSSSSLPLPLRPEFISPQGAPGNDNTCTIKFSPQEEKDINVIKECLAYNLANNPRFPALRFGIYSLLEGFISVAHLSWNAGRRVPPTAMLSYLEVRQEYLQNPYIRDFFEALDNIILKTQGSTHYDKADKYVIPSIAEKSPERDEKAFISTIESDFLAQNFDPAEVKAVQEMRKRVWQKPNSQNEDLQNAQLEVLLNWIAPASKNARSDPNATRTIMEKSAADIQRCYTSIPMLPPNLSDQTKAHKLYHLLASLDPTKISESLGLLLKYMNIEKLPPEASVPVENREAAWLKYRFSPNENAAIIEMRGRIQQSENKKNEDLEVLQLKALEEKLSTIETISSPNAKITAMGESLALLQTFYNSIPVLPLDLSPETLAYKLHALLASFNLNNVSNASKLIKSALLEKIS
jgi:hypothetical protein